MKFFCSCDFRFLIDAENYKEALEKGWDFIHINLPESFSTEGAELYCEELEESE